MVWKTWHVIQKSSPFIGMVSLEADVYYDGVEAGIANHVAYIGENVNRKIRQPKCAYNRGQISLKIYID